MMVTKTIEEICDVSSGGTPSRGNSAYFGGNIPWVKSGELHTEDIYHTEETITEEGLNNSSAKMYPPNTVLLAMYGATVGQVSILRVAAAVNQAICAMQIKNDEVTSEYLYYFLKKQEQNIIRKAAGGGQPNISAKIVKKISITYPESLDEQRAIVATLKSKLEAIASIEEKTKKQMAELEAWSEKLIEEKLVDSVHETWNTGTIEDYAFINPSIRELSTRPDDSLPVSFVPMPAVSDELGAIVQKIVRPYGEVKKGYTYLGV